MYFLAVALIVTCLSGCTTTPKERGVTVSDVEITGTIKEFVKAVDGMYKFTNNGDDAFITVKFELIENPYMELCLSKSAKIRLNAVGEDGHIFDTGIYGFIADGTEIKKMEELLTAKIGTKKSISFKWDYFGVSKEDGISIFNKAATFEIIDDAFEYCTDYAELVENGMMDISEVEALKDSGSQESNYSTKESKGSSGSKDWDEFLDSFEKYVDQYLVVLKKMNEGDASAMIEYTKMMENIVELSGTMDDAKDSDNLSAAQITRYLEIYTKFINGMRDTKK